MGNNLKKLKIFFITSSIFLFIIPSIFTFGQQNKSDSSEINVLFFGNSFTGWNNMPSMLEELTNNSNHKIYIDDYLLYGRSLYEISQLDSARRIIASIDWDYIILQDSPYRYAYPEEFNTKNPLIQALYNFDKIIRENSKNAQIILFMPWAYKDGKFWDENSPDDYMQMQTKVYENIILIANKFNYKIAPVGWAWSKVDFNEGGIELFSPDLSHPTLTGSYLTACVIYSTIFKEELSTNPYYGEISKDIAEYLQTVASTTVLSELETWNLLTNIKSYQINDFELYQNYPNPFNSQTTITFSLNEAKHIKLEIFNLLGQKIDEVINMKMYEGNHSYLIDAEKYSSGIYYYQIQSDNIFRSKKMVLIK